MFLPHSDFLVPSLLLPLITGILLQEGVVLPHFLFIRLYKHEINYIYPIL